MFELSAPDITMSSREIADLTDKRHDNVMRDIRAMLEELHGDGGVLSFEDTHTNHQNGKKYPIYRLPKRETMILVSGYSITLRAKIIDRWQELEENGGHKIPRTMAEALRLAADQQEAMDQAKKQIRALEPKARAADRMAELQESICITEAAKHLKVQRKQLVWLMTHYRWMYKRSPQSQWLAYDDKRYAGLLEHAYHSYSDSSGEPHDKASLRITPKGLVKLAEMCADQGNFMNVYTHEVATQYDEKRHRKPRRPGLGFSH